MQILRTMGGAAALAVLLSAGPAMANSAIAVGQCDRYGYTYG